MRYILSYRLLIIASIFVSIFIFFLNSRIAFADPGFTIQPNDANNNPINGPGLIDGGTSSVTITFNNINLSDSSTTYGWCFYSNLTDCTKNNDKNISAIPAQDSGGPYAGSNGMLLPQVFCGDGQDKVYVSHGSTKCTPNNWFYEGNTYQVSIYKKNSSGNWGDTPYVAASFLVIPVFPKVVINGHTIGLDPQTGDVTYDNQPVSKLINTTDYADPIIQQGPQAVLRPSMELSKVKACGNNCNRYYLQLSSYENSYSSSACTRVKQGNTPTQPPLLFDNKGSLLSPGTYTLSVQDQVNSNTFILSGIKQFFGAKPSCNGGYTYYTIPFNVDNKGNITINLASIQADPESVYLSGTARKRLGVLPCTQGVGFDGSQITINPHDSIDTKIQKLNQMKTCTQYQTAIGDVGITPVTFIQSLAKILLEIGAVAVLGYLLYGSWLILTSRGDKEKLTKAREVITSAIIGFVFILLSFVILGFVGVDILHLPGIGY